MIKNRIQGFVAFSFTALLFSCSATKQGVEWGNTENMVSKTDSLYMEIQRVGMEATKNNHVPGVAIAVIQHGKVAWTQSIGFADVESKKPVTPETIFNVGSVSKMVSAWGLMQLTEKGLVKLDDPVDQFLVRWKLPASPYDISKVTLRRILSHTAGLSVHGYGGSEQGTPLLSLEESLSGKTKRNGESVRLISEPGTKWEYSGGGYTLAQLLLEERTKEKFAVYMKKNVFEPLGLNHTHYEWTEDMMANSATAYDASGKPIKNRIFTEQAAAGLQTTVLDLAHFAELSITSDPSQLNKVLKSTNLQVMEKQILPFSDQGKSGLGYRFMNYEGLETIGHTGENEGWSAGVFMHLPTKSGIVILCNGSNGDRVWYPIYQSWAKRIKENKNIDK
ncbi:CubicO group peptidase (beta-lactamase class C family) [Chryseobacterium rhizosphaerae]|uniref:serine hydrolase domain-containing protein n=1 Tax=Chryseobacterium rhizosphaerae TaxID=395937 RepID=UPI00285FD0BE|nr:serine hydrolase domain-containing protein [Chryseobacterium rhizosphaerae]MDR6548331.1 CubicO group peptidase (beta-lactamase class C family) [Chryseobacterium rhizosphaerae]